MLNAFILHSQSVPNIYDERPTYRHHVDVCGVGWGQLCTPKNFAHGHEQEDQQESSPVGRVYLCLSLEAAVLREPAGRLNVSYTSERS